MNARLFHARGFGGCLLGLLLLALPATGFAEDSLPVVVLGQPTIVDEPLLLPDLRTDLRTFPAEIWEDTRALVSWQTAGWIVLGSGLAATSDAVWDDQVRDDTAVHARRWGGFNNIFDIAGHPATHLAGAGAIYTVSLITDDPNTHRFSRALLHSLIITDVTSTAMKYAFETDRPNGERRGFPSGHTASSFAVAAVVQEHYGWPAGIGAYTLAGLVGWQRIDDRAHDLSDVIFGAALGIAVGKAVAQRHLTQWVDIHVHPYSDPERNLNGLMFEKRF